MTRPLFVVLAGICLVACGPRRDTQAAEAAIAALRSEHLQGVNSRNADLVLSGYAEDAVYLAPDSPPLLGRAALGGVIRPLYQQVQPDITMTPRDLRVEGDWAVEWGCLGGQLQPIAGGDPIQNDGRYLLVYRWTDATGWMISRGMYNSGPCDED